MKMKNLIRLLILFHIYQISFCFKPKLSLNNNNNNNNNNNLEIKRNNFDRNLYAKYLKDIRKTQKALIYLSQASNFLNKTQINNYQEINNYHQINNTNNIKLKQIIIDNKIYIDIENIKTINIIAENGNLNIELDKKNKIENVSNNIKDFDLILNLVNIILAIQGNS